MKHVVMDVVTVERTLLHRELRRRFGVELRPEEGKGFRYDFVVAVRAPSNLKEAALCTDWIVDLTSLELALRTMCHAAAFFPAADRAQKVCDAFVDVFEQTPGAGGTTDGSVLSNSSSRGCSS